MYVIPENIQLILDSLPDKPGCYLMKDQHDTVIYVGKAISLRSRVRSYFHANGQHNHKGQNFTRQIANLEWIVVGSELEALLLEMNLIKKYRPKFNVRLKDDKRYPYIKVHWKDDYPKVTVTRRMVQDGSRYFGPYLSVWAVHKTLDVLRRIFPYLSCDRIITGDDERACLYYDIKLCTAPCIGRIDKTSYRQMMDDLCSFLNGKSEPIVERLELDMQKASEALQFEKAAVIRDQIAAIENVVEKQRVFSNTDINSDVIALARNDREACIQVFFIRSGKMIGREYFMMEGIEDNQDEVVLSEFIKQFYEQAANLPNEVLLPKEIEEARIIKTWLEQKNIDQKIEIKIPQRGKKKDLLRMATENATETLQAMQSQWERDKHRQVQSLNDLKEQLKLSNLPNRIECYDISNTQGTAITASMVVFEQGIPSKQLYRRFNIRSVEGKGDDFASMEEALRRRFKRWQSTLEQKNIPGAKVDPAFSILPDLLIVDGGKGQLSRAVTVLDEFGLTKEFVLAGLAKQNEELFLPQQEHGILISRKSEGLYLLQRIRDEAHRFAITAHRKRRSKLGMASQLDSIPGIGPQKRKALLMKFGSIAGIKQASIEELTDVKGINLQLANELKAQLS